MHIQLELLAPAKNAEIGIAAIDCGADAVYIAGPSFGARQAAGNSIEDLHHLCNYAHRYGVRIFVTFNTLIYDEELEEAKQLLLEIEQAGADAIIVQDMAVLEMARQAGLKMELHASTQCAIRTPEQAKFLESLGYSRIVLERELSIDQIRDIRGAVDCELEFFVHGALCVCYSGQCYISEYISGRSANRGACMQACRSRYDLVDASGKVLVKNKALLSLKDYKLIDQIEDLAEAGICSFKIEGRLKNISYVKNVVRAYSLALDKLVSQHPERYCRASFGHIEKGFTPDLDKTFNRGYTSLYINGKRGNWSSMDAPKGMGELIGKVASIKRISQDEMELILQSGQSSLRLANGDGFSFYTDKEIIGFRGDVCNGLHIRCKRIPELKTGMKIFRNLSIEFEKSLNAHACQRELGAELVLSVHPTQHAENQMVYCLVAEGKTEDGRTASCRLESTELAQDTQRMRQLIQGQLSKKSGIYNFKIIQFPDDIEHLPFLSVSQLNSIRRNLAEQFDLISCKMRPDGSGRPKTRLVEPSQDSSTEPVPLLDDQLTYKQNIANHLARNLMQHLGARSIEPAFELAHQPEAELMRSKYCIRYELGICPRYHHARETGPLYLTNNGQRFVLEFDCRHCEMVVKADS